jgi:preprotein translocase subunit SecF
MMQIVKPNLNFDFVGQRKIAYTLSLLMLIITVGSLIYRGGPKFGIDFAGGAEVMVQFKSAVPIEKVKATLQEINLDGAVQAYGDLGSNSYRIVLNAKQAEGDNLSQLLEKSLKDKTQVDARIESFEMVGPQVGQDMREKALLAIFFSLLLTAIYISGRFEFKWLISLGIALILAVFVYVLNVIHLSMPVLIVAAVILTLVLFWVLNLKYAMGATVALIHDVMFTVGLFSILDIEFNLPIIAAILTIIGYSLNDTIVIFDRIRENLPKFRKEPMSMIVNKSVNETLSRTILTAGTSLLVTLALFLLGGGIIHDFAFAMLIGVITGTYSTVFIASPILLAWQRGKQ